MNNRDNSATFKKKNLALFCWPRSSEPRVSGPWRLPTLQQVSPLTHSHTAVTLPGGWLWKVIFTFCDHLFFPSFIFIGLFFQEVSMTHLEMTLWTNKKRKNSFEMFWISGQGESRNVVSCDFFKPSSRSVFPLSRSLFISHFLSWSIVYRV